LASGSRTTTSGQPAAADPGALLRAGRLTEAIRAANARLAADNEDTDALYVAAVCQRYLGEPGKALQTLQYLLTLRPDYGRAWQERGHCQRGCGDAAAALESYAQAVTLNPALPASWEALRELRNAAGDTRGAALAAGQLQRLSVLPPELVSVDSMLHEGKLLKAERLCRAWLQKHPRDVEAMRLLAQLGLRYYVLDDAEFLLESALEFEPGFRLARYDYVQVLHKRQKFAKALEQATILRDSDPGNLSFEMAYANESLAVGDFTTALQIYDDLLAADPEQPNVHLVRGHALKTVGRQDEAISAYTTAVEQRPGFGDAYWSLANLKTYRFDAARLEQMLAVEARPGVGLADRYRLCFALGKALEDREQFAQSFEYYARGNALKKAELRYSAERMDTEFASQQAVCTAEFLDAAPRAGNPAPDPIFIVGLPRAGSTLLEQILASHSQVDGTLELPNILAIAHRLNGRRRKLENARYPGILRELDPAALRELGDEYLRETQIYRAGAPRFTDKMPNNFRHIGLISLILPNAKIIDARRHPLACCFSGYKQLFAEGQEFSYGLEDIGRYYRGYVELMAHWDRVLPGRILRVNYEDVVSDLETQVRRLLEFCELEFEPACLDFHATERAVRTASSEQVRQPIYLKGLEQWRNYEPWLAPLQTALGELAQT
jgi:tetratricopeptide (TPR) repeat protein